MAFKENLSALMNLFRLSNTDLSKKIHVDASVISRWRNGNRTISASSHHLYNLAKFILSLPFTDYQEAFVDKLMSQALSGQDRLNNALRIKALMDWLMADQNNGNSQLDKEIFDNSPVAIAITRHSKILYVNQTCLTMFECQDQSSMRGRYLGEFITLEKINEQDPLAWPIKKKLPTVSNLYDGFGLRKDGKIFHAEIEVEQISLPDGPAQSNFIFDISDRHYLESRYLHQLTAQQILLDIAKTFSRSYVEDIDGLIDKTLQRIGRFDGSDRCFIYMFSQDMSTVRMTHEWCQANITAMQIFNEALPCNDFPWFYDRITHQEYVYIPDVEVLPVEAANEQKFLKTYHVKSMLAIPVLQEAAVIGFLGLHTTGGDKLWSEEAINWLEFVAQIIANHLAQKKYYQDLKMSELYYKTMFNTGDAKLIIDRTNEKIKLVNSQFEALTGYSQIEVVGQNWRDLADAEMERHQVKFRTKSGKELYLQVSAAFIPNTNDLLISMTDHTEIFRLNRTLDAIRSCNSAIIKASSEHELLATVCNELVAIGGYALVWVGIVSKDILQTVQPVFNIGANQDYIKKMRIYLNDPEHNQGPAALAITRKEIQVIHDLEAVITHQGWLQDIRFYGYKSLAALPFQLSENDRSGVIVVYSDRINSFDENEIDLLKDLVSSLAYGINALHAKNSGDVLKD